MINPWGGRAGVCNFRLGVNEMVKKHESLRHADDSRLRIVAPFINACWDNRGSPTIERVTKKSTSFNLSCLFSPCWLVKSSIYVSANMPPPSSDPELESDGIAVYALVFRL